MNPKSRGSAIVTLCASPDTGVSTFPCGFFTHVGTGRVIVWTSPLQYPVIHPPIDSARAVTFFLKSFHCSGLNVPAATAIGIRAHIGGLKVFLQHATKFVQLICQPTGRTGGYVALSLLDSDADL